MQEDHLADIGLTFPRVGKIIKARINGRRWYINCVHGR